MSRHGTWAVLLGRMVPGVRSLVLVAGRRLHRRRRGLGPVTGDAR